MTEHSLSARKYYAVFAALMVLTGLTVLVSFLHLGIVGALIVALAVASLKGGLVASFFMHLIGENNWIYLVLIFTAFFFVVLLSVPTLVTISDYSL